MPMSWFPLLIAFSAVFASAAQAQCESLYLETGEDAATISGGMLLLTNTGNSPVEITFNGRLRQTIAPGESTTLIGVPNTSYQLEASDGPTTLEVCIE
jgi:hypothetical protein